MKLKIFSFATTELQQTKATDFLEAGEDGGLAPLQEEDDHEDVGVGG